MYTAPLPTIQYKKVKDEFQNDLLINYNQELIIAILIVKGRVSNTMQGLYI